MEHRTWKVSEIAGSDVLDENGHLLGKLVDVLPSGSNDIWVVRTETPHSKELLIPALATVIRTVDVSARRIIIAVPPGLKEIYEEL